MASQDELAYLSDLRSTLLWVDQIYGKHYAATLSNNTNLSPKIITARKEMNQLRAILTGNVPTESTLRVVRLLISSGVLRWRVPAIQEELETPPLLFYSLVTAALWPLIITPKLPHGWVQATQEITSPETTRLIAHMRSLVGKEENSTIAFHFSIEIQKHIFAEGVIGLLEDLRDPQKGGGALNAIATIRDNQQPPTMDNIRELYKWLLVASAGGIIGNRSDAIVVKAMEWLSENAQMDFDQLSPSDVTTEVSSTAEVVSNDAKDSNTSSPSTTTTTTTQSSTPTVVTNPPQSINKPSVSPSPTPSPSKIPSHNNIIVPIDSAIPRLHVGHQIPSDEMMEQTTEKASKSLTKIVAGLLKGLLELFGCSTVLLMLICLLTCLVKLAHLLLRTKDLSYNGYSKI